MLWSDTDPLSVRNAGHPNYPVTPRNEVRWSNPTELLDFAHSEGIAALRPEFVSAVPAGDWPRVIGDHLYVRYAGHAPDHPRNKAFAQRWNIL